MSNTQGPGFPVQEAVGGLKYLVIQRDYDHDCDTVMARFSGYFRSDAFEFAEAMEKKYGVGENDYSGIHYLIKTEVTLGIAKGEKP